MPITFADYMDVIYLYIIDMTIILYVSFFFLDDTSKQLGKYSVWKTCLSGMSSLYMSKHDFSAATTIYVKYVIDFF
jgi:hypothetical protein